VGQHDRQRHQLFGLGAGVSEHEALVTGAAGIHAHRNVGRLTVNRRQHGAGFGVEAILAARISDFGDCLPDYVLVVDNRAGGNLARHHRKAGRDERFARDAALGVLGENRIQNGIGNLIGDLVGVTFGH
jgi:hypothetical protein